MNNTRQGPISPLRGSSEVCYKLHVQFFAMRDDIQRFYHTDKHILLDREPNTNELIMTQDRELGTEQCKQVLYCELNKHKPNIYITTYAVMLSWSSFYSFYCPRLYHNIYIYIYIYIEIFQNFWSMFIRKCSMTSSQGD